MSGCENEIFGDVLLGFDGEPLVEPEGEEGVENGDSHEVPDDKGNQYTNGGGIAKGMGLGRFSQLCLGPGGPPCSEVSRRGTT